MQIFTSMLLINLKAAGVKRIAPVPALSAFSKFFFSAGMLLCIVFVGRAEAGAANNKAVKPYENNIITAPSFVLSGTVVDEKGDGIPGVTVRVKGTTNGVVTDIAGKFIIEIASETDSIQVTYIGYKPQTLLVGNKRKVTIALEPDVEGQKLNEVQVVAYGTQKKATLVGAISSISATQVQKYSTPSLSNALAGRLAGVVTRQTSGEPGYDAANIFIRGLASQSGNNKPLIIVDGVERDMQNYWNTINIQDIESFSVLKDATSTAPYGNRGANGVLLITTKRGTAGKPKVTFRTEGAIVTPFRLPDYIDAYDFASLHNEALANVGLPARYTDAELQKYKDGSDPYLYPNVNWNDVIFRDNTKQLINNLGITGGTEAVKYYVNLGYSLQQGIYEEDKKNQYNTNAAVKKYNFRSNTDFQLTKSFSLALGLSGTIQTGNFPGRGAGQIFEAVKFTTPNAYPLKNPNGSSPGGFGNIQLNPYAVITQTGYTKQYYTVLANNLSAKWDLSSVVKGLSLFGLVAYDVTDITQNVRQRTPELYNYLKDAAGNDKYTLVSNETDLGYYTLNENYKKVYVQGQVNYNRSFGKHGISGLVGAERQEDVNVNAGDSKTNLPARRQGLIGRVTYNYDSRYLLEVNAGYNGSEQFRKGKQYGFFPSIGAGYLISNESFWNKDIISTLKFRGSYGAVGNDRTGGPRFIFQSNYNKNAEGYVFGQDHNVNPGGKSEDRFGLENNTWETAYKTDLGIDLELFNGKIALTADVFKERREGQLIVRGSVPLFAGYPSGTLPYGNLGITKNKGFDATLMFRNTTQKGFYYSITGTVTYAKNVIIENDAPPALYPYQEFRGQSIGSNLGYVAIGLFQDQQDVDNSPSQTALQTTIRPGDIKYKDLNGDNKIDNADRTIMGGYGSEPRIIFSLGGTVAWKGFDATIFFQGAAKRDYFSNSGGQGYSSWIFHSGAGVNNVLRGIYDKRWIPGADNSKAVYPAVRPLSTNNYIPSTMWQINGDYLRIRNAELGYTFPSILAKRISLKSLRVFVQGTNLATWDHIKIVDPESQFGTGGYPTTKNINFGLDVSF
jgi:TonB-linked SusC/RagA family outer membrane protein